MKRIKIGCPEISPMGGYRSTYIEVPEDAEQPSEASIDSPEVLALELQLNESIGVEGYRLVTEEPNGDMVQEFYLAPDAAYELFLIFKEMDKEF